MEYRLNKTSESINKFISDYARERGVDVAPPSSNKNYDHLLITNEERICYCSDVYKGAIPIGIDDFLSKIDELAEIQKTITISSLAGNTTTIAPNGDINVGCTTIPEKQVKNFIKEYTIQPLPEKNLYVGGDFFMTDHEEIYMLVYSNHNSVQLVNLNGRSRYTNPIVNPNSGQVTKEFLSKLSAGRPLTYIKNPYKTN